MTTKKPKITFKLKPRATGLAAVGANSNRGSTILVNGVAVGSVLPSGGNWRGPLRGWSLRGWSFYVIADTLFPGSAYSNEYNKLKPTAGDAKAAAKTWILAQFAKNAAGRDREKC